MGLQVGQALIEVRRLGPDPAGDEQLVVIGKVHERREVLAQPDRVEDGEPDLAGRHGGEEPQHERLEQLHRLALAGVSRLDQDRSPDRKRHEGRQFQLRGTGILEPGIDGQTAGEVGEGDLERAKR